MCDLSEQQKTFDVMEQLHESVSKMSFEMSESTELTRTTQDDNCGLNGTGSRHDVIGCTIADWHCPSNTGVMHLKY